MSEASALANERRSLALGGAVGWRGAIHLALFIGFLAYSFIGTQPLGDPSVAQRADGSALDRIAVLGLFGLALLALALDWRAALAMVPRNIGLGLVVAFCLASVFWSDHPDLTIRRAVLLFMLTVAAAAVAAGVTDLRRFHTVLFAALVAVVLINLAATAAAPGIAITDLGVRGIYTQKNVAGVVGMIAAVTAATWIVGADRRRDLVLGLLALLPILVFLAVTRSKTSVALTALAFALIVGVALVERCGPRAGALAIGAAALFVAGIAGMFAAVGFDAGRFIALFTSDATFTGRDELWAFAIDRALERPWLGHGYGAFWDVGPAADPLIRVDPGSWLGDVEIGTINQAHNGYLELSLHIGLPIAMLAALVVVTRLFVAARSLLRPASRAKRSALGLLVLMLLLYLLHNLTEATLFMRGVAFCNIATLVMFLASRSHAISTLRRFRKGA